MSSLTLVNASRILSSSMLFYRRLENIKIYVLWMPLVSFIEGFKKDWKAVEL